MLLKVCVNGNRRAADHAALPIRPEQIAADVAGGSAAGAGAAHVHVKDDSGADTFDPAALTAVMTAVRAAAPGIPIGVTTGAWASPDPADRVTAIRSWTVRPDFAR